MEMIDGPDSGYMEVYSSTCWDCVHRHGQQKCDAFDKIPEEIRNGDNDHTKPYPGDHGIRYEERKRNDV